ncbi:MAG: succinylglutamate desuccinylase/aspartoacylase family protein, partial [Phycisphaerales bacterium JB040]
ATRRAACTPAGSFPCTAHVRISVGPGSSATTRSIRRVAVAVRSGAARLVRGELVALVGNVPAFSSGDPAVRYLDHDLNRAFTRERLERARGSEPGSRTVEEGEAIDLLEAFDRVARRARGPVHLIDLHTTSAASEAFAVVGDALANRSLAQSLGLPIVLGLEEELAGVLSDYATEELGFVSLLVEGGQHDLPGSVDTLECVVWAALHEMGCVRLDPARIASVRRTLRDAAGVRAGRVYDLRYREPVLDPGLTIPPRLRSFDRVVAGHTLLAVQHGQERIAPESGVVLMPNRQKRPRVGDDAAFVARPIGRVWLSVSAWARGGVTHRLLPLLAPGVRRRPGHARDLLVAPEIAAVCKREVFHLLGYRLVRRGKERHLRGWARARGAFAALGRAAWSVLAGVVRGGERGVLRAERGEDWVVRRRRLDVEPPAGSRVG